MPKPKKQGRVIKESIESSTIPRKVSPYSEGSLEKESVTAKRKTMWKYRAGKDEIDVVYWARWPSYDFIFGVPARKNKNYGVEACFFQYRDKKHKRIKQGFYVDLIELHALLTGFRRVAKLYKHIKK